MRRLDQWRLAALVGTIALSVGLAACTSDGSTGGKPPGTPTAQHFGGTRTVGALFQPGSTKHTCTASVVESTPGNLLITAAHCISGTAQGYTFAPGYHGGTEPFGSWTVVRAYGAPEWITNQVPQSDFAFLVVAPRQVNGQPQQIQQVTGGNQLGTAPASGAQVTVPAYPQGSNDNPITCVTHVYYYAMYPTFNCDPYVDGTSGAPWLQQSSRGSIVVGVLGGLHQGGCPSWTSYSSAFGPDTLSTYSSAAAGAKTSTFPTAGGNGC